MRKLTLTWEQLEKLQPRPEAQVFPMFTGDEMGSFLAGMREDGYRSDEAIILYEGQILDGRNRLFSALKLYREGVLKNPPPCVEFDDAEDSPISYVMRKNLLRRHLSIEQKAVALIESLPFKEDEAAKRKAAGQQRGGELGGRPRKGEENLARTSTCKVPETQRDRSGYSAKQLADEGGFGEATMVRTIRAHKDHPDLYEDLKAGKKSIGAVYKEMRERDGVRQQSRRRDAGIPRKETDQKKKPKLDMPWVPPEDSNRPIWHRDGKEYPLNSNGDNRMSSFSFTFSYRYLARAASIIKSYLTTHEMEVFQNELREQDIEPYPDFGHYKAVDGAANESLGAGAD